MYNIPGMYIPGGSNQRARDKTSWCSRPFCTFQLSISAAVYTVWAPMRETAGSSILLEVAGFPIWREHRKIEVRQSVVLGKKWTEKTGVTKADGQTGRK